MATSQQLIGLTRTQLAAVIRFQSGIEIRSGWACHHSSVCVSTRILSALGMPGCLSGEIRFVILDEEGDRATSRRGLIVDRDQLRDRFAMLGHHDGAA